MVDVSRMPQNAFGYVPTPALVAPIEFTLRLADYATLGGYVERVRPVTSLMNNEERVRVSATGRNDAWPLESDKEKRRS
jgi:hypothetical protein